MGYMFYHINWLPGFFLHQQSWNPKKATKPNPKPNQRGLMQLAKGSGSSSGSTSVSGVAFDGTSACVSALMGWWDPVLLLRCMAAQKQAVDPIKKTVSLQTLDQLNINKRCLLYINCNIKRHIQHECHIRTVVYLLKHSEPLLMIILQPTPANMLWHMVWFFFVFVLGLGFSKYKSLKILGVFVWSQQRRVFMHISKKMNPLVTYPEETAGSNKGDTLW